MSKVLVLDLKKLQGRAFDRAEWAKEVLQQYHTTIANLNPAIVQSLRMLHAWMFVPPTLWPFNVQDILENCLLTLEKKKSLTKRQQLLVDLLPEPPDETVCAAAANHELHIQKGVYENLVKA